MKLRTILLILALISIATISIGGYLYYSSLKDYAFEQAHQEGMSQIQIIASHINSTLDEHQKSVKALAELKELGQVLEDKDESNLLKANIILDHFHQALNADACYLMDEQGNTVASSNRNTPDSFVGKNYAFRPYFQEAKQGNPSVYMALGITSGKRGVYFSHPVYGELNDLPTGVVVIKGSTEAIEQEINHGYEGVMLLTDPHGVIFISNREDWLFHVLWKVSPDKIAKIAKTKQFGNGPWNWIGVERENEKQFIDKSGIEYHLHKLEIKNYPGWNVIYLHNSKSFDKRISDTLFKTAGLIILIWCLVIGLAVFFLYREARHEIILRKKAEEQRDKLISDLEKTLSEVKTLRGFLPICSYCKQIRDDKGYWNQVESYIYKHSDAEFSHGICPECAKKYYPEMDLYDDEQTQ